LDSCTIGGSSRRAQLHEVSWLLNVREPVGPKGIFAVKYALVTLEVIKLVTLGRTGPMGLRIDISAASLVLFTVYIYIICP
jgi:hypothetical protein